MCRSEITSIARRFALVFQGLSFSDWIASITAFLSAIFGVIAVTVAAAQLRKSVERVSGAKKAADGLKERLKDGSGSIVHTSSISLPRREMPSFEVEALEAYYNQALQSARISFWFSLGFACIGFAVIIFAFASHTAADTSGTIIKVVSGTVIDTVAGLFFVQSNAAQKSMGEFFDKLRLDRLHVEARDLVNQIENGERRDQLRAQLVLKYAGINQLLEGGR
jgi:hypothetical protein